MTDEEIKQIETRLEAGKRAKIKVERITEAIRYINDSSAQRLNIAIQHDHDDDCAIFYSRETDPETKKWFRVCWTDDVLPGIAGEIQTALKAILGRRLESAIEEYKNT